MSVGLSAFDVGCDPAEAEPQPPDLLFGDVLDLWDTATGAHTATVDTWAGGISAVASSPDGRRFATTNRGKNTTDLWDAASKRKIAIVGGHASFVYDLAFAPDSRTLATASTDHSVALWAFDRAVLPRVPASRPFLCVSARTAARSRPPVWTVCGCGTWRRVSKAR